MGVEGKKKGALSRHDIHLSILINLHYGEYIMCRLRTFYECSDGTMGWAEIVLSYDEDIAAHIRHWSIGGRMVISEHIDLV